MYAVSNGHAHNLTAVFVNAGIQAAVIVSETPSEERNQAIESFKKGTLRVLVNVAVGTEGFDLPDASCVVLARPTMSLALYLQMVGRGLRPKPDGSDCLILDLAGNVKLNGFPDNERQWSLEPRGIQGEGESPPVMRCPDCEGVSPAASHNCRVCEDAFGKICHQRCGKWRAWKEWNAGKDCGSDHDQVCNLCHPDAHVRANLPLPEGLKEALRKEPIDSQMGFKTSDMNTVEAARDLLCEVMENLIYSNRVDDTAAFTRILERQLKPLLIKERQFRNTEMEKAKAELITTITPALAEFIAGIHKLYKGQRKVIEIGCSFENGISYRWEENGEVHTSDWTPWTWDASSLEVGGNRR